MGTSRRRVARFLPNWIKFSVWQVENLMQSLSQDCLQG
jgi:hypothetical protein